MDKTHIETVLLSIIIAALVSGANAALQRIPPGGTPDYTSIITTGALVFLLSLLASLKTLYEPVPGTGSGLTTLIETVLAELRAHASAHATAQTDQTQKAESAQKGSSDATVPHQ